MTPRWRAIAVVSLLSLSGCGVLPTGLAAVSVVEGRMTFAIVGCEGDVDNTRFFVTGPRSADGKRQVLGEWHQTEPMGRRAALDPERLGTGWIVDQSLDDSALAVDRLQASAAPDGHSGRGTDDVTFTRAELDSLTPGAWMYTREQPYGDEGHVRKVNKIAESLDELVAAADEYSCFD